MNSYHNHNINTHKKILFYENNDIKLIRIQLHKPVIYLKEFYSDEVIRAYYEMIVENMVKKDSSHFFYFFGKPGTGKSTFTNWILYGLHLNRPIIFLKSMDFERSSVHDFLKKSLYMNPQQIFVFDAGDEKNKNIIPFALELYGWVKKYIGLKVIYVSDNTMFTLSELSSENGDMLIFPEFMDLSVDKVNLFFSRLGMSYRAVDKMNHSEIFKTYSLENISWKNQQQ
jgi:hypothetical protein